MADVFQGNLTGSDADRRPSKKGGWSDAREHNGLGILARKMLGIKTEEPRQRAAPRVCSDCYEPKSLVDGEWSCVNLDCKA